MRLLLALLCVATFATSALAVPFVVDPVNQVIETSQIKLQFALDCPERVASAWYKPFSTVTPVNGESLPWEFSGQMIQGLWASQGPIFSQSTDATDHSWTVISQTGTRLVLRIESHSTWAGQLNPRVRTDYTFFADSSSYMVDRTVFFSEQNWPAQALQVYVFRVSAALAGTQQWRNALGTLHTGGFCGSGCWSADWDRTWSTVSGPVLSVTEMNHPSNAPAMNLMNDNDANSGSNWTGPYTPSQAWTTDQKWRVLVHFSTTPGNTALEDVVYAWFAGQPVTGVAPGTGRPEIELAVFPNPAARTARISFTLPVAGDADLGVFDLAGRRVATLATGGHEAGGHSARWDGTSSNGGAAAPGVYLVRLRTASGTVQRRLAWLR